MVEESLEAQNFRLKNELHEARQALALVKRPKEDRTRAEVMALEHIISKHFGPLPLPNEELRLHVGAKTTASNFLLQGWQSSRKVLEVFGEEPAGPVLDWGCGTGRTLRWLLDHPVWSENYRGTDVDAVAIEWLKKHGIQNVTVCSDEVISLPYQDTELSGLFSFSVLTHIHPHAFRCWFQEIARVLRPGALAYLTFNGDSITKSKEPHHAATAEAYRAQGFAWLEHPGNYKSAAFVSHDLIREYADGIFQVDKVIKRDYDTMDVLYARAL